MEKLMMRIRGGQAPPPPVPALGQVGLAWLGGFIAISVIAILSAAAGQPLVLGSFGASCVLIFGYPDSPFSQPRNVIGGHVLTALIGLVCFHMFGSQWWSMALALATSIAAMQVTRTVHPPAGSNPLIVMLAAAPWSFLITPTLLGALALQAVAVVFHAQVKGRSYPKYWA
jgi:CBS-domain-containing membrane protein